MTEGNIIKSKSEPCPSMGRKEGSSVHPIVAKQRSTVNLPDVVLRRVISYLGAHDLRAFHQVCSAWKAALEDQSSQNRRRILLVEKIRVNKENLLNGSAIQVKIQNKYWKSFIDLLRCKMVLCNGNGDIPAGSRYILARKGRKVDKMTLSSRLMTDKNVWNLILSKTFFLVGVAFSVRRSNV